MVADRRAAWLGDLAARPRDERTNDVDPEGVRWVRKPSKSLAAEGRTVFLLNHLMSELPFTAEHVLSWVEDV